MKKGEWEHLWCPACNEKTSQIDASVYVGDYHNASDGDFIPTRLCVECGSVFEVKTIGKAKRLLFREFRQTLPVRYRWRRPMDVSEVVNEPKELTP